MLSSMGRQTIRVDSHQVVALGVGHGGCGAEVDIGGIVAVEPFDNGSGEVNSGLVGEWEAAAEAWVHLKHIIFAIGGGEYVDVEVADVL